MNNRKDYNRTYYLKHQDELKAKSASHRESHREEVEEYQKRYWERHLHPCLDCGKLCGGNAPRCKSCASIKSNAPRKKVYPPCIDCGGIVVRGRGVRCRSCASKANRKGNWIDDNRYIATIGYVMVRDDEGRRNGGWGYIYEHVKIWETAGNKKLPKGWHIHHLNGIKTDNRLCNLVALPSFRHYLVLQEKAKRIQELEALLRQQGQLI